MNTPYYIPYVEKFRSNIEKFVKEVRSIYPNYMYGYSFKTNSYKPFCIQAKQLSCLAEIVSPYEYNLAKDYGFKDQDIIYNGVIPDFRNKLDVVKAGGIVNLESEQEIYEFIEYSNCNKQKVKIGIRLNIGKYLDNESRFGIDINSQLYKFLCKSYTHPYLSIKCIHCHIHGARSLEMFEKRIDIMAKCANELDASIIDIGGNMYGNIDNSLKKQYKEYVPTMNEYAHCIGQRMKDHFPNYEKMLINEGATLIVSDCMDLVTKVLNIKNVNGKTFIVVDTKPMDVGFVCGNKNPTIEVEKHISKTSSHVEKAIVEGCACMEDNIIGMFSGNVGIDDCLVVRNIGVYSFSVRNSFITEPCKVKLQ